MRKLIRYSKRHYWQTVAGSVILPGALAGVAEYALTQGVSGLIPILAAVIGGVLTMALLNFIQPAQENEEVANTESRETSRRSATPLSVNSESTTIGGTSEVPIRPVIVEKSAHSVEGKFFSPRTPAELVYSIRGLTEIAAEDVIRRHIGHWLRAEGSVQDVSSITETSILVLVDKPESDVSLALVFESANWRDKLASFDIGDPISAIGKIKRVSTLGGSDQSGRMRIS